VAYHVALELNQEQVKKLKLLATTQDTTVKDLVSELVKREIQENEKQKEETEE